MKMRKVPKRFLAFGMLICMIVSLFPATALAGTSTRAGGAEYQLTDEWENRSPVENAIEFEGADKVTFHALPGELGMYTNAQNVLLYDAPAGDFTAAVKVTNTALTSDYQTIGLAAFASESRVAGTMRRYHSGLGGNVFAKMNYNGNYDEYAVADTDTDAPVWLKLERSGSEIIHSYSYDGTEFTEISRTTDNADLFACDDLKIAIYTGGADTFDATAQDFTVNGESVPFCTEKIVEEDEYELTRDWTIHSPVEGKLRVDDENRVIFHSQQGELGQITDAKNVLLYDMPDGDFTATVKVTNTELTSDYQTIGLAAFASVSRVAGTMRRYHSGLGGNVFAKMNYNGGYDEAALPDTNKGDAAWLRLERNGDKFIHSYSYDGENFTVIVRAYDDGVAFSYELDTAEGNEKTSVSITDEMSTVNIPEGAVTWSFENGGSYEDEYHRKTMEELGGTPAIPLLYQTEDLYVLFNEANLIGSDFCGSRFKTSAGSSTFELDFAREQSGAVTVQFPFTSPWRYAVAGDLGTITENTMAENLSPAPDEEKYHYSDWVEPGVASWTWLAEGETREGQENIDAIKRYIDMAAELGWKYFLWDDGWQTDPANNVMNPHAQEVIDYAAERGIGILVWVNEDYIANDSDRETRFKMWSEMGIKGIKADFFDGEQQSEIAEYEDIYKDLAKYKMVGIMHGCNKATGETRTYPHILSREAIRGDEFVNRQASVQEQLTILPYIRCASGPADYTPLVDLPNKYTGEPIGNTDKTIGSQLTIPVLIEAGIPCMADKDTTYLREDLRGLFEDLPAAWDETRFISGEVGEYVTLARRSGDTWYIAGNTNDTARTEHIDFAEYVGEQDEYLAQIWYDGPDDNDKTDIAVEKINVTAADSIDVKVARKGGFTIKLTKFGETEPVSTAVLEYVLGLAEDVDTDGVVDSVVEIFNDRKAAAYDILERAEAGDPSVTQSMIDQSWSGLIEIMQYMSFKQGDMTDLQKVVDLANSLDLTKYLDEGQQEFKDALAAAEAVLEDELTEQTAIDQAWKSLLKAMSELRLKPSKDALEELIASAQSMSTEGVSEETAAVFRSALARAVNVYEDEQATEEEVASAQEELQTAIDQMLVSAGATEGAGRETDSSSADDMTAGSQQASGNSGSGKADGGSQTTISSGRPAVKTGDTTMPIAGSVAVMALAAAGAAAVWKKKREI